MVGQQPLVERHLGALKHGSDRNGKLLAAIVALDQSGAVMAPLKACSIE